MTLYERILRLERKEKDLNKKLCCLQNNSGEDTLFSSILRLDSTDGLETTDPNIYDFVIVDGVGVFWPLETDDAPDNVNTFPSGAEGFVWKLIVNSSQVTVRQVVIEDTAPGSVEHPVDYVAVGSKLYVANSGGKGVVVFNTPDTDLSDNAQIAPNYWSVQSISYCAGNNKIYAPTQYFDAPVADTIYEIDPTDDSYTANVITGGSGSDFTAGFGHCVDPDGTYLYFTKRYSGDLTLFKVDIATWAIVDSAIIGAENDGSYQELKYVRYSDGDAIYIVTAFNFYNIDPSDLSVIKNKKLYNQDYKRGWAASKNYAVLKHATDTINDGANVYIGYDLGMLVVNTNTSNTGGEIVDYDQWVVSSNGITVLETAPADLYSDFVYSCWYGGTKGFIQHVNYTADEVYLTPGFKPYTLMISNAGNYFMINYAESDIARWSFPIYTGNESFVNDEVLADYKQARLSFFDKPYRLLAGYITQTGTNDPVFDTIFTSDTLSPNSGNVPIFTRDTAGNYVVTGEGLFPDVPYSVPFELVIGTMPNLKTITGTPSGDGNTYLINTKDETGADADDILNNTYIELKVYVGSY